MVTQRTVASRQARTGNLRALPPPRDARQAIEAPRRLRRILFATDGTGASRGALAVAALLARRDGAAVDVVSALPRWGPPPPAHDFLDMIGELIAGRLARVMPQSERAFGGGEVRWTVRVIDGNAIPTIADVAEVEGHDLIITGRRRGWVERLLRRRTALGVAQRTSVPVLAVPPSVTTLPTRVVVGVADGGDGDRAVVEAAAHLLEQPAHIHLVHVLGADESMPWQTSAPVLNSEPQTMSWDGRLDRLTRNLDWSRVAAVERVVLRWGEPARQLLDYAKARGCDLIALGARRPTSLGAQLLGGVARRVLRGADRCVLLASAPSVAGSDHTARHHLSADVGDDR